MKIYCKRCEAVIPAANISLARMLAKCAQCHSIQSITDQTGELEQPVPAGRPPVAMPPGVQVEHDASGLHCTRRWRGPAAAAMLFQAIFVNCFVLFWYAVALSQGILIMALVGVLPALAGLCYTYAAAAGYLNKTVIRVNREQLAIQHGPLPFRSNVALDSRRIQQLYCKEKVVPGKHSETITYEVHAATTEGKNEVLLKELEVSEQALYIEQEMERALGIRDLPVRGELGRQLVSP